MAKRLLLSGLAPLSPLILALACGGTKDGLDTNGNGLADDLGKFVVDASGHIVMLDINGDGITDGPEIDVNGMTGLGLDTNCDNIIDGVDTNRDGIADILTSRGPTNTPGCKSTVSVPSAGGSGAGGASGGMPGMTGGGGATTTTGGSGGKSGGAGGKSGSAGAPGSAGAVGSAGASSTTSQLGKGSYQGTGDSTVQYEEDDVYRSGVGYKFIANGWGTGWQNHHISWNGTSFKVLSLNGSQGTDYSPAGYPTMFCGLYTKKQSAGKCGLPGAISSLSSVKTGWRWMSGGNNGQYNAAWDIWLGNGTTLSAFLMVWLRDPPGQQPAGAAFLAGATVTGLPGTWNIWRGTVVHEGATYPIVNYVQPEGHDLSELEFDVLDVYRDAIKRPGVSLPGTNLMAVAVGYEVWNGPVTNLVTEDFYVDVK
jgi:hypothetical protein